MTTDDELNELYQEYWVMHSKMLDEGYAPVAIAGVLMAQAMTMYKTVLNDTDYKHMIDAILVKHQKDVKPLDIPTLQ